MIYLLRHGETEWNRKGIMQGHLGSPLTEKGKQQAPAMGEESYALLAQRAQSWLAQERKHTVTIVVTHEQAVLYKMLILA